MSEAITLVPVGSGLEGMSVRHGLKERGKSPYGLAHMARNAAEWVNDWYDREYYQNSPDADPPGPKSGEKRVLRGGSWADLPTALRVTLDFQRSRSLKIGRSGFDAPWTPRNSPGRLSHPEAENRSLHHHNH